MRSALVVDDSATIRLTLARAIQHARKGRLDVHEADEPGAAMKVFHDVRPDVVFLDMVFPDEVEGTRPDRESEKQEAGLDLLKEMLRERPDVSIVLVTGLPSNHPDVVDAVNLGAAGCLRKPIRPDDVRAVLEALDPDERRVDYIM